MNKEATWKRLVELGAVDGQMPAGKWDLRGINLSDANLSDVDLSDACIYRANFSGCDLAGANLRNAYLFRTDLSHSNLYEADLSDAILLNASVGLANLAEAQLQRTHFTEASLYGCNLYKADLTQADLRRANLTEANLLRAILVGANLTGANLTRCSLIEADISSANLTSCKVYGCSAWDIKTNQKTIMQDLIVNREDQLSMMVDDIEIAQFIYMIADNQKISKIIDNMRTKAVLILGSFDDASMAAIAALKGAIRNHGMIPLLFTFEQPKHKSLMGTVRTMAELSSLVIVDQSIFANQIFEMSNLVLNVHVPFARIAREGSKKITMDDEAKHFDWYQHEPIYYSTENAYQQIFQLFTDKILPWAQEVNAKLNGKGQISR